MAGQGRLCADDIPAAITSVATAGYTAFLFVQCEGRGGLAGLLALLGMSLSETSFIRAGQSVPLS